MRPVDVLRFRDQSRFKSPEITRAFVSAMRAVAQSPQSEMLKPDDMRLTDLAN